MSDTPLYAEDAPTGNEAYDRLMQHFATITKLEELRSVASTDMQIHMPAGSGFARTKQLSALDSHLHGLVTSKDTRKNLEAAEDCRQELSPAHQRNLTLMRRKYDLAASLPSELVREKSALAAESEQKHTEWKQAGDFESAQPYLARLVELAQQEGEIYQELFGADSRYDGLLQAEQPGMGEAKVDTLFAGLDDFLGEAVPAIMEKQAGEPSPIALGAIHDSAAFEHAHKKISAALGLDYNRAVASIIKGHPFSGGTPDDVRLTTVMWPDDPVQTVFASVHETGHAMYDQNLPLYWRNQPLGNSMGMGVHESQSLFWENQIGHSRAFMQWLAPKLREFFNIDRADPAVQPDNLHKKVNRVQPGLTRIFADEVTYPLHVKIRHDIAKALINGKMRVDQVPEAWNEGYRQKLGIVPADHGQGVLQDPHWPAGEFGYFPQYTLGSLGAAQLDAAMRESLVDLDMHIQGGDFQPALNWLREKVHKQASMYDIDDLMQTATGAPLGVEAFKQQVRARYLTPD